MTREETILLLELILKDIRGNWYDVGERIEKALNLAKELKLQAHINSIIEYLVNCTHGDDDGRFFRCSYMQGGYEGMNEMHGLEYTIIDKSDAFKKEIDVLTYPNWDLQDWDKYKKLVQKRI